MTDSDFKKVEKLALKKLQIEKTKEMHCHVQFVVKMGLELARKYNADEKLIQLSCLLHDVGRDLEEGSEDHGDAGARITRDLLSTSHIPQNEQLIILSAIKNHCKSLPSYTLEEKIVITADSATKVLYHEAFMLLCKKQTFDERRAWGLKYLEKGYKNTLFHEVKEMIESRYKAIKETYMVVSELTFL